MSRGVAGARVAHYDYALPAGRIARYPTDRRDQSRLMVLDRRGERPPDHRRFADLPALFESGDVLVVNESRVFPARLRGRKPTGAPAEILLLHPAAPGGDERRWEALVRPGGKLKPGRTVEIAPDLVVHIEDSTPDGGRVVRLETPGPVEEALARHGTLPLPPYLDREAEPLDRERYQTVYARVSGSVAAPTAGLHFTPELVDAVRARGVEVVPLVLHVGVGTFRPVEADDPDHHPMHEERFWIPDGTAAAVAAARARGGRVWAVGTTVVRALESAALEAEQAEAAEALPDASEEAPGPKSGSGMGTSTSDRLRATSLFIRPPFEFRVVDALVTNFHLPRSTLLMLVAAFAGYERTMAAYAAAIEEGYRFYSYGDAMVIR